MASEFGPLLRRLRVREGMTQEGLAERSGLGVRTVRGLETGERGDPRMGTVDAIATALGLPGPDRAELLAAATGGRPPSEPVTAGPGNRVPVPAEPVDDDPFAEPARQLAHELRTRLRREEERRQIQDPVPLPVRWEPAAPAWHDSWENIRKAKPHETAGPLDLTGQLDQIVTAYRSIPSGRLVVLGRAGSGKTILTSRFVLGMLDVRAPAEAVPVIFSVGSWNPTTTGFRGWLTEQLLRDHPGLAAPGPGGSTLAELLVEAGRILPVLDGFDEIAAGLHRPALAALNATTLPLLLTSRLDEYRAAVASTDVLTSAGAVVLTDLTVADLADYLPRTTRKRGEDGPVWDPVLAHVRDQPRGDLAAVLATPLMVGLARTIYSDTPDRDPTELLDPERFGTRAAIERHLIGGFVPTVYRRQPGTRYHDVRRVERHLGFLAHHLDRLGTHDLAWWQLGNRMRAWQRMVVSGLVLGIACGVPAGIVIGLIHIAGVGTGGGGVADGLLAVLAAVPLEVLTAALTVGLAHGAALAFGGTVFEPSRVRIQLRGAHGLGSPFLRRAGVGAAVGTGLGAGFGVASLLGATFWIVGWIGTATWVTVVVGLALGLLVGLVWGVIASFEVPVDIRSASSPMSLLHTNRGTSAVQALAMGLVMFATYVITVGLIHGLRHALVYGLSYGFALGLTVGLGFASLSAWGTWMVFARFWLPLNGRLPWSLPGFLEDAYARGVLRRAGAVYQFRHAHLQDHLKLIHRDGRKART